ncbi:amyloid fiber anchoring/assembly protein TapA [Lentibacillus sediminis]|uniref:amyloid fiber anchoring/assembly protein TapA n=1 Tax=Lentibacillus sediminis TaxID=1940529 RepID=UPI000C1C537B|nr:amyloid fiber anchoring/assembly protein TapA [Lentibacillus sediminis]
MRQSRLRKYKSRFQWFLLIGKVVMIWYLIIFSTTYLVNHTSAQFTDARQANGLLEVGHWEEEGDPRGILIFTGKGNQNIDSCKPITIKAGIKNIVERDMTEDSTYEVFYAENGNPEKGEKQKLGEGEGTIKALASGEITELTFYAEKPGRYVFLAYQHEDHKGDKKIWSEKIRVDCSSGQKPDSKEESPHAKKKADTDEENKDMDRKEKEQNKEPAKQEGEEDVEVKNEDKKDEALPETTQKKTSPSTEEKEENSEEKQQDSITEADTQSEADKAAAEEKTDRTETEAGDKQISDGKGAKE